MYSSRPDEKGHECRTNGSRCSPRKRRTIGRPSIAALTDRELNTVIGIGWKMEGKGMVKVKSSQKIFTDAEIATLTGICLEHLRGLARRRHLGFIARADEAGGKQADQWLFTQSDLIVLAMLYPCCEH